MSGVPYRSIVYYVGDNGLTERNFTQVLENKILTNVSNATALSNVVDTKASISSLNTLSDTVSNNTYKLTQISNSAITFVGQVQNVANTTVNNSADWTLFQSWITDLTGAGTSPLTSIGMTDVSNINNTTKLYLYTEGTAASGFNTTSQIQVRANGYYRCSAIMSFYSTVQRANVKATFQKRAVDGTTTEFGAVGASGYIRNQSGHNQSSVSITHVILLNAGERVGVVMAREGVGGTVECQEGKSNFSLELVNSGGAVATQEADVGIGTTAPSEKLDVVGNILASGTITGSHFYGDGSNLTGITATTATNLNGGTVTATTGTFSGASSFGDDINLTGLGSIRWLPEVSISSAGMRGIYWGNFNYGIYRTVESWTAPNYAQLKIRFFSGIILDATGTLGKSFVGVNDRMSIGATYHTIKSPNNSLIVEGNVGIGTTSPAYKLDVAGASRFTGTLTTESINSSGVLDIKKNGTVANFQPVTSGSHTLINFNSKVNNNSDKGFILVQDKSAQSPGTSNEDLRMTIGVYNDFRSNNHSDELWFQGGGRLCYNVGSWDSELNSIIGTPSVGSTDGGIKHEWRINNSEKMSLNSSGNLAVSGNITGDTIFIGNSTSRGLRSVTGGYGTVQTTGGGTGNNEGYSIDGRYVFMSPDNNACGIFNDLDNKWILYSIRNEFVKLFFNGGTKFETTNTGVYVSGTIISSGNIDAGKNTNTTSHLGYAAIGQMGTLLNVASFAHSAMSLNNNDYALTQTSTGYTYLNAGSGKDIFFQTDANTKMVLMNNGNLGIGTSSPEETLDIEGSLRVGNGDGMLTINSRSSPYGEETVGLQTSIDGRTIRQGSPASYGGEGRYGLALQPDGGNVGIGNTVPGVKLDVTGDIKASGYIIIRNNNPTLILRDTDHRSGMIQMNDNRMYFLSGGVDTQTSSQVNGRWPLYLQTDNNEAHFGGNIYAQYGTVYASGGFTSSDDRLKHNEVVITSALSVIRKLSPQRYDKTLHLKAEDFNGEIEGDYRVEAGLIAQDILEIPELAFVVSGGGDITNTDLSGVETTEPQAYAVDYNSINAYHIAATKELDELLRLERLKTAALESQMAALESQMATILNRLTALEN